MRTFDRHSNRSTMRSTHLLVFAFLATAVISCYANERLKSCRARRVLLISVDGLHQQDLVQWLTINSSSTLAKLSKAGITYNNAYIDGITDSFPGVLALTTGGNVAAHGVYYDDSYSRSLWPPGTPCVKGKPQGPPGTEVVYDESIDYNPDDINGGGVPNGRGAINATKLPLDRHCNPVYPHQFVQTNTIFEVVRSKGGHTAWADKHPAYDLLNGPSGKGVEELYTPEINSKYLTGDYTTKPEYTMVYDEKYHVEAALNWTKGQTKFNAVPDLYGFNFQTVSVTQKVKNIGGYDKDGKFLPSMVEAMQFVDAQLGRLVSELKERSLYDSTVIIVTAKHGQAPIIPPARILPSSSIKDTLTTAGVTAAQITKDDVAIIWLEKQSQLTAAVNALEANKTALGIVSVIYGEDLEKQGLAAAGRGHRADIVVKVEQGVIYANSPKGAEHGGLNPDDQHVALLVSGGGVKNNKGRIVDERVFTKQVAPSIVSVLGCDPSALQAVRKQDTQVLPWL